MMDTRPNIELLRETLDWVRQHDAEGGTADGLWWDQTEYLRVSRCGTAACLAGARALLDGGAPCHPDGRDVQRYGSYDWVRLPGKDSFPGGHVRMVETWARDRFGITANQSMHLFDSGNSIDRLATIIDAIAADPNAYDYSA